MRSDGAMAHRAALLAVVLLLGSCADDAADPPAPRETTAACAGREAQMDLPYVDGGDPQQRLDLYYPPGADCDAVPVVVWVHGGGWSRGDKANGMDDKVRQWTDAGWAVASVNYRLTDAQAPAEDRVVAPSHNEDVAAALSWLATDGPAHGIDPERMALVGHSAGAAITAAIAADPAYLAPHDLEPAALACAAPLDTEGFDVAAVVASGGPSATLYRSVFGADPSLWPDLSPLAHVGDAPLPDLFLVRRGTPARRAQVDGFAEAARTAGAEVTVVDLPGFSHEDVNRRVGEPDDDVLTPALQAFLVECLGG